ncbi:MarR family winged helix-turn-helix transcriptional regulator [Chryseobacterium sp. T1]
MNYKLLHEVINLLEEFETKNSDRNHDNNIEDFKAWIAEQASHNEVKNNADWEGKENGRSIDSIINTLIINMNRYAKSYSKSAIYNSDFSTQEEFIYLINLKAFGKMSKIELIKKNVHEKSIGIKIIDRLVKHNWVLQEDSLEDKRTKILSITEDGIKTLDSQMQKIRQASKIVLGNLSETEKNQLLKLLQKLDNFHQSIYDDQITPELLIDHVSKVYEII